MKEQEIDSKLKAALDDLQPAAPRDPGRAARGRAIFLEQASRARLGMSHRQAVLPAGWIHSIFSSRPKPQRTPAFNALLAAVLALAVFFGGTGVTVYASQNSLPDQALYPVKTWSEDTLLALAGSSQARMNYALDFSDRRLAEMNGLLAAGDPIPGSLVTRLQNQLDRTLELAAGLDDPQMLQELQQLSQRTETQLQKLTALAAGAPESARPALLMAQARIQEQLQLCALGQSDPQDFRMRVRERKEVQGNPGNGQPDMNATPMPTGMDSGPGSDGSQSTGMPGGMGPGPMNPDRTPQPGGGSGHMP